jgi:hypothetical protein
MCEILGEPDEYAVGLSIDCSESRSRRAMEALVDDADVAYR